MQLNLSDRVWKISVIHILRDPPLAVGLLSPHLQITCATVNGLTAILRCQCQLVPAIVEGGVAMNPNGDNDDIDLRFVTGEQIRQ